MKRIYRNLHTLLQKQKYGEIKYKHARVHGRCINIAAKTAIGL